MAYLHTAAHHTASAAEQAGDVWIEDGEGRAVEGLGFATLGRPAKVPSASVAPRRPWSWRIIPPGWQKLPGVANRPAVFASCRPLTSSRPPKPTTTPPQGYKWGLMPSSRQANAGLAWRLIPAGFGDLGFAQFILPAISLATQAATTGLQLSWQRKDAKEAKAAAARQEEDARKAAAAEEARRQEMHKLQVKQMEEQQRPLLEKAGLTSPTAKTAAIGGAVAVVALIGFLVWRKRRA